MAVVTESEALVSVNPARWDDVVIEQPRMSVQDVQRSCARLRESKVTYPIGERSERLREFARLLSTNSTELAKLIVREVGKLPAEAEAEASFSSQIAAYYADRLLAREHEGPIRSVAVGLAGIVTPFNFPCSISVMKLCSAFGAGAPVVWKPSPHAIGVADRVQELGVTAFGDVVATVPSADQGAFEEVARQVDALSFTGGHGGAAILWRAAGDRPIPMQLELGSCNATIVGESYEIEDAAATLRTSVYSYAGQKCSSTRRILVSESRVHQLFDAMADVVRSERVADPADATTSVPPLVAPLNADRFRAAMGAWAAEAGNSVSSDVPKLATPCFVSASIFLADHDRDVFRGEVFGPAAVMIPYSDFAEALAVANATPYGLFAGLLTHDAAEVEAFQSGAKAGILKINQTTTGLAVDLPSQGWDASGMGPSELGPDPFRPFQRIQTVYPYALG